MNKRPWMPLWVNDFLGDTTHLTAAETGAYIHLIIFYWVNGKLPCDDNALARIARLNPMAWKRSRGTLESLFRGPLPWQHPRIDREIAKAIEISQHNSANAKRRHYGRAANGGAVAMPLTPTHTYKKAEANSFKPKEKNSGFYALPQQPEFLAWKEYAKKQKQPMWSAFVRELEKRELENRPFQFEQQWPPDHVKH